eukprot:SAG11_NODE_8263_length_1037_cov_2.350746_2_plen_63_part_01
MSVPAAEACPKAQSRRLASAKLQGPALGDDDLFEIDLPFPFPFYNQLKTTAKVSSNGERRRRA